MIIRSPMQETNLSSHPTTLPLGGVQENREPEAPGLGRMRDDADVTPEGLLISPGNEEHFQLMANEMAQLAWMARADGHIYWYNKGWYVYTGTSPEAMEGWGWQSVHDPAALPRVMERWTDAIARGEPFDMTFPLRGADGIFRLFLTWAVPVKNAAGEVTRWFGTNTNVNELKRAEAALRLSEQRFRTAVGIVSNIVWTNNATGRMEGEQTGWADFTGQSQEEYEGYGWSAAIHPDDAATTIEEWNCAVAEKRMFEFEHRVRRADGEWRSCSIRAVPILGETGEILEWVGVHTDITDRKHNEETLRASEERLRAFVAASEDVVYRMNADWSEMGPLDGRNFLTDAAQPTRAWMEDNIFPEDLAQVLAVIREAIRTKSIFSLEHRVRRADGSPGWTVSKAVPLFDDKGEIVEWFGTASDVTEQHEAAEALRASDEFMRSIIASSPDCIKVLDLDGRLLSMEAGQHLLGIKDITPYLNTPWLNFWVKEEDKAMARAAVASAAAGGEGRFTGYFRPSHGGDKWWEVAITPILDGLNAPVRLLAVSRDVTERRELEAVLVARAEELARADRSKDEFLAMLAHELRNPLAPLRNASELLNVESVSYGERTQAQRIISRQIENMSRMIDDLLDVSRITEGKIELRRKPVSLESVITAAISLARSGCAAQGQELTVSLPPGPVFLDADATRLEQVFSNLLGNACKYAGAGCHIALQAKREQDGIKVSIRDNGVGIAPDLLPRIFDLFVQSSRSLDRSHGGLGIGLTLVQRLVELHGGRVEAHSAGLGRGAEFIVRLPVLATAPVAAPLTPPSASVRAAVPRRLLIVDDNSDSAVTMATLQTRRGHITRTAFTGPEALIAAAEFLPEVVLLDIGLPGMDGFEVARRLRAIPQFSEVLLIAMTGYATLEDRAQCRAVGFDEHLIKPVDLEVLRGWLASHPRLFAPGCLSPAAANVTGTGMI